MTVQILRKKFTVGQYHQMIESGILTDRDQTSGRGRVSLPKATQPTAQPIPINIQSVMLVDDKNSVLGEKTSPLPVGFGNPDIGRGDLAPTAMKYDPAIHHRRSIRLKNYDYSQAGAYFVTICTQGRACLLGEVVNGALALSQYGVIVEQVWHQIPQHFSSVTLDAAVIMPNHFHGIIVIAEESFLVQQESPDLVSKQNSKKPTLGQIVAYFKYQSTKLINAARDLTGVKFWQRNYYEHIIRSEGSLAQLRTYIEQNPQKWQHDQLHPQNPSKW